MWVAYILKIRINTYYTKICVAKNFICNLFLYFILAVKQCKKYILQIKQRLLINLSICKLILQKDQSADLPKFRNFFYINFLT